MREKLQSHHSTISKVVILIPVLIILLALIVKRGDKNQVSLKMAQFDPSPTIVEPTDIPDDKVYVDLEGPSTCVMKNKEYKVTAQIKNSHIAATIEGANQTKNYILTDDCLYIWARNERSGIKKCDMAKVMPMVKGLAQLHLLTINDTIAALSRVGLQGNTFATMKWDKPVCQKTEVKDTVFNIPGNVAFIDPTPAPANK